MTVASHTIPADRKVDFQPFSAGAWFEESAAREPFASLVPLVDRLLALPTLARLYRELPQDGRTFWDRSLEALEIAVEVPEADISRIPIEGPLVVVANHPFGCADGLALLSIVSRARSDVRLLGNALLSSIPELRRVSFFVDVFGGPSAVSRNAASLRDALRWLEGGGALTVFPAGQVSHVRSGGSIVDAEWSDAVARLAVRAGATVVPCFFHGTNSRVFHAAGRLNPRLRTLLLIRELLRRRGRTIPADIGEPITANQLARIPAGLPEPPTCARGPTGSDRGQTRA